MTRAMPAVTALPNPRPPNSDLQQLSQEMVLADRLRRYGREVFTGTTDREIRKSRIRNSYQDAVATAGAAITPDFRNNFAASFQAVYGEPL